MEGPEKPPRSGNEWLHAVLPNPFIVSEAVRGETLPSNSQNQPPGFSDSSNQHFQYENPGPPSAERSRGLLAAYLPDFGAALPRLVPILDGDYEPPTPPQIESPPLPMFDLRDNARAPLEITSRLRGMRLLGAVFSELTKHLGADFSTAQLMQAAQQLIDISKAEYVGIPYKEVGERAGYYSWDLVRAFISHQWQIACVETNRMHHCDIDEFTPESYEAARMLIQGRNERIWEF